MLFECFLYFVSVCSARYFSVFCTLFECFLYFVSVFSACCLRVFCILSQCFLHVVWVFSTFCVSVFGTLFEYSLHVVSVLCLCIINVTKEPQAINIKYMNFLASKLSSFCQGKGGKDYHTRDFTLIHLWLVIFPCVLSD